MRKDKANPMLADHPASGPSHTQSTILHCRPYDSNRCIRVTVVPSPPSPPDEPRLFTGLTPATQA